MSAPNAGILDTVLNTFRSQIDSGFGALQGPVNGTLGSLIVISVVSMAIMWAIDDGGQIWAPLIRKAMTVGFWAYLILNWQTLALSAYTAFGNLGATVGGASGLSGFLNSPSQIVALGIKNAQTLLDLAAYYCGVTNQWGTPPQAATGFDIGAAFKTGLSLLVMVIEAVICALIIFIAYFWLALEVVVTTIEFHIVILMGFCLLPFGVFERTSSYAERVLGYVISAGMKVMALGVVIALGTTYLTNTQLTYTPGSLPGLDVMAGDALEILILLMLALSAPKYAQAVVSGGPTTGVGSLAGAAGLVAATGLAIGGAAKLAGGAVSGLSGEGGGRGGSGGGGGAIETAAAASSAAPGGSPGSPAAPTGAPTQGPAGSAATPPGSTPTSAASTASKGADLASAVSGAPSAGGSTPSSAPATGLAEAVPTPSPAAPPAAVAAANGGPSANDAAPSAPLPQAPPAFTPPPSATSPARASAPPLAATISQGLVNTAADAEPPAEPPPLRAPAPPPADSNS
jgi:type IV secretion system protein TrbL